MNLDRTQIVEVLDDPEITYCARGDRRMAQRGGLAVVWDTKTRSVITVLYRRIGQWDRAG